MRWIIDEKLNALRESIEKTDEFKREMQLLDLECNGAYSIKQLSAEWAVSVSTIRRLISKGQLKALKIGSQVRIPKENVVAYSESHKVN